MIREFIREDIYSVLKIENECFNHPWSKEMFESELNNGSNLFVLDENGVIGYMDFHIIQDFIELNNIAVKKTEQKKGNGKKLLTYMFEIARSKKINKIFLEVNSNNEAYYLYKKNGFTDNRVRKNYYPDGDGIEMVKEIR